MAKSPSGSQFGSPLRIGTLVEPSPRTPTDPGPFGGFSTRFAPTRSPTAKGWRAPWQDAPMSRLELQKLSHVNAIVDGYRTAVDHFHDQLGFQLCVEIPARPPDDTDACLMNLGGVIFEFFAPRHRAETGQGRLLDRYGPNYIGAEFSVPDVAGARAACEELGVRIINDLGHYFFTYPGACCGISFEIFDRDWHEMLAQPREGVEQPHSAEHWRDVHPLGVIGLARLSAAVGDLDTAVTTLTGLTGGEVIGRAPRPQASA